MKIRSIVCPSGLRGEVRSFKVREYDILADRRVARRADWVDTILANCWQRTLDAGPYAFESNADPIDWSQVLQGDRFYALMQIRIASFGSDYDFDATCQRCQERIPWTVPLTDLPVKPLPEESVERFRQGNRFETILPGCGTRVVFRLVTGADEKRFARQRREHGDALWTLGMLMRLVEVEGTTKRREFIRELDVDDAEFLRGEFDRVDCGVETDIEIECGSCYAVQTVELPFDERFFLQDRRKRSSPT